MTPKAKAKQLVDELLEGQEGPYLETAGGHVLVRELAEKCFELGAEDREKVWAAGYAAAARSALQHALGMLVSVGVTEDLDTARLAGELADVRQALRQLSERLGCNTWSDTLRLADVIEKHIGRAINFEDG